MKSEIPPDGQRRAANTAESRIAPRKGDYVLFSFLSGKRGFYMKKYLAIILSILLAVSLFGCKKEEATESETHETETHETRETVTYERQSAIIGIITEKISPDILVLDLCKSDAARWGEIVHVVTDDIDDWEIDDDITVGFTVVELPNDSSQFPRFLAESIRTTSYWAKPIIYFYPTTAIECSVKLALDGILTCTYPDHGENGWESFTAYPDGTLAFPDGKEYYALYWEGIQNAEWDMTKGFCVKGEDTAEFLEWALAEQGLTSREANEFIIYWLPLMQENAYNVISFQTEVYTDSARLEITPTPDSLLRIFMVYYATDDEIAIEPQTFESFEREGFAVVEWGGSEIK